MRLLSNARRFFAIRSAVAQRRPLRLAIQASIAGLGTFAAGHLLGLAELSWAVITALFVVQASVGGTLGTAAGRMIGAFFGAVFGVAWIVAGGAETRVLTGLGIVVASGASAYISGWKPTLRYGAVTAAVIIMNPGSDPLVKAWHFAAAIGLGGGVGALAGLIVFPWSARRGVHEEISRAVRRCGDLLAACLGALMDREADELSPIHGDIRQALENAQAASGPSRSERLRRASNTPEPEALIRAVERLWHALILFDRVDSAPLPEAPRRRLQPYFEPLAEECCAYLSHLSEAIGSGHRPSSPAALQQRLDALRNALDDARRGEMTIALPGWETERVFTIIFAFEQLNLNIIELARLLDADLRPRD